MTINVVGNGVFCDGVCASIVTRKYRRKLASAEAGLIDVTDSCKSSVSHFDKAVSRVSKIFSVRSVVEWNCYAKL